MSEERLLITIEGKDGVSKTFVAVTKGADSAGKAVEKAGKTGGAAMKQLAAETEKTALSADDLSRKYTAMGAAVGTALGTISKLGASYRDQRLQMQSLEDQYGTSADAIINFTEAIQDHYNQSNDAARASALTFATLYRNYEMGEEQIIGLMERTADISAARGRNMTEVSQMVQNALRGEAEYIEQIGVTLNDTYVASQYAARGLGNWNTLTDEAARAQFRYVLLMEQTVDTQGRAAEEADRAGGMMRRWINETQDGAQAAGRMLGPLGEMGAEFSQIAIGLPVVAGGLGRLVGMLRSSATAMRVLSLAAGPVGIAITALTVIGGAFLSSSQQADRNREAVARLTDEYLNLKVAAEQAIISGDPEVAQYLDQLRTQIMSVRGEAELTWLSIFDTKQFQGEDVSGDRFRELMNSYEITRDESDRLTQSQNSLAASLQDPRINAGELAAEIDRLYWSFMRQEITADQYITQMEDLSLNTSRYVNDVESATEATTGLAAAFGVVNEEARGWLNTLLSLNDIDENDSFATRFLKALGTSEGDRAAIGTFIGELGDLYSNLDDMPDPDASHAEWVAWVNEAEQGTYAWRLRVSEANQAMAEQNVVVDESNRARRRTSELIREEASATQLLGMDTRDLVVATIEAAAAQERFGESASGVGEAFRSQATELAAARAEYEQIVSGNLNALMDVSGFAGLEVASTNTRILAMETMNYGTALDTVFRATVSNTNAIGSQSEAIHNWALELIGVQGEYSKLDDLVNSGRISGEAGVFTGNSEYAQAQRAFNDIARENAEIQEHVLTIQAKQAPIIRDQMVAYEDYLQIVADMPAQQQLIALGWMDSSTAARAMEFQTLAVAAAMGDLGTNGEAVFTDMITGAAQADPVLKALLIDMGLISEGADGTITVNLDGAEGARSEIGALNESIGILIDLLDDGEINGSFRIDATDAASPVIRTARQNLEDADGDSATMSIHLNDFASLGISAAQLALNALDGKVATTTIQTIYQNRGIGYEGRASGGVIGRAGGGTIPVELAEAGGEIIHFASGGTAFVGQRGVYGLSPGDFVVPNNAVSNSYGGWSIDLSGSVFNNTTEESMNAWAQDTLLPEIRRATADLKTGMGVG